MKTIVKTKKLDLSVFFSLLTKPVSLFISFITIPIALNYLGQEIYGLWVTIFGVVSWINFFDFGLGHGLRNKLSEALALKEIHKAKLIIQTGYSSVILIAFFFLLIILPIINYVDWVSLMNTNIISNNVFIKLFIYTTIYVFVSFILNLIKPIYYAYELPQFVGFLSIVQQLFFLLGIVYLTNNNTGSILAFCHTYGVSMIISATLLTTYFFLKNKLIFPEKISLKGVKETGILNLGISFFVIQISILVLQSSDNIIITSYLGPKEVVPYSIVLKLFTISSMLYGAVFLNSLRSSITHASKINDISYLNVIRKRVLIGFFVAIAIDFLIYLGFDFITKIWLGDDTVVIPVNLKKIMFLYSILLIWNGSFIVYLNALSKLKGQLIISIFQAIINIPLSIFLINNTNFGSKGVILATILCMIPMSIYAPLKCLKIRR